MEISLKRYRYFIAFIIVVGLVVYYYVDPTQYSVMPKCPIKLLTTLDCPGCGFQRALHAFLHGRFSEAIHYNLFLVLAVPVTFLWWVVNILTYHSKRPIMRTKLLSLNRCLIYFYVCCYFIWFAVRNIYQ